MARGKINLKQGDEFAMMLNNLASEAVIEEIAKKALYEGMKPVADAVKGNLVSVIKNGSGSLVASMGVTPIKKNDKGGYDVKVGFNGYDSKGVPNQLKARVLESGSSKQSKRPFFRRAVNATRGTAISLMQETIDKEIKKIGGK